MEFILMAVVLLFIIPFPKKWKFVWRLRFLGLALLTLTTGIMIVPQFGLPGQVGGVALILISGVLIYLTVRTQPSARRSGNEKK